MTDGKGATPGAPVSPPATDNPQSAIRDPKSPPRLSLEGAAAARIAALIQMRRLTVQLHPDDGGPMRDCIDRLAGRIVTGGAS